MNLPEHLLRPYSERWEEIEQADETTLVRLSLLRDLVREIHAEKSSLLAKGSRDEASKYRSLENRINDVRSAARLDQPLWQLLDPETEFKKRTRLLPETLFNFIPKNRFERYDRQWECAIAAEAASIGWKFWALDAWVEIPEAENWHRKLSAQLLPHGIILFAETLQDSAVPHDADSWHGRWFVVLRPRFLTPNFGVAELPGTRATPHPPRWKLLFTPKQL